MFGANPPFAILVSLVDIKGKRLLKAHPFVPGSSTCRGGGRNLKRGWVSQFSGALSRLSACRWQFHGLLARAGLSRRRSLVATQCPPAPAAAALPMAMGRDYAGTQAQWMETVNPGPLGTARGYHQRPLLGMSAIAACLGWRPTCGKSTPRRR
jgi:hypothetical protein